MAAPGHTRLRQLCSREAGGRFLRVGLLVALAIGILFVEPGAAQANPVCEDESDTLVNMLEGFVQLTTGLGIMGLLVVWQADVLMEMFTLSQEKQAMIKQHEIQALKSAGILVLLGPLFMVGGRLMDLPIAQCVNLIPF